MKEGVVELELIANTVPFYINEHTVSKYVSS